MSQTQTPDQVLNRIFAAIDDHEFDSLNAFYADDVQARTIAGNIAGKSAVIGMIKQVHEGVPVLQHLITGPIIEIDGETATVRANLIAVFGNERHEPAFEGASVWRGRLAKLAAGWQVVEFSIDLVWARGTFPTLA